MGIHSMHKRVAEDRICLVVLMTMLCFSAVGHGAVEPGQEIVLPERGHPYLAATAEELTRVRQAYRSQGPEHAVAAAYVGLAE